MLVAGAIFALFDVVRHQTEAFAIVGTMVKGAWIGIMAAVACCGFVLMMMVNSYSIFPLFLASIGGAAIIVYWVDIRSKLNEVQGR